MIEDRRAQNTKNRQSCFILLKRFQIIASNNQSYKNKLNSIKWARLFKLAHYTYRTLSLRASSDRISSPVLQEYETFLF